MNRKEIFSEKKINLYRLFLRHVKCKLDNRAKILSPNLQTISVRNSETIRKRRAYTYFKKLVFPLDSQSAILTSLPKNFRKKMDSSLLILWEWSEELWLFRKNFLKRSSRHVLRTRRNFFAEKRNIFRSMYEKE